jgi:hypothetical protein
MINISLSVAAFVIFKWAFLRLLLPTNENNDSQNPIQDSLLTVMQCSDNEPARRARGPMNIKVLPPAPGGVLQPSSPDLVMNRRSSSASPFRDAPLP